MDLKKCLIGLLIITQHSCKCGVECFPEYTGRVLSHITKQPIEAATVKLTNYNIKVKTDKMGFFKISASGCIDAHIKISNAHYKPFEITFSSSSNFKSYRVSSESKFVDYNKPFYPDSTNANSFITGTWISQNSESFLVSTGGTGYEFTYFLDTLKPISEEIKDIQKEMRARNMMKQ